MQPPTSSHDSFFDRMGFPRLFLLSISLVFLHLSVQVGLDAILNSPLLSAFLASGLVMILLPLGLVRSSGVAMGDSLSIGAIGLREIFFLTVLTVAMAFPVDLITGWNLDLVPPPEGLAESMAELRPGSPLGWAAAVLVLVLVAPLGEELVFRGLLQEGAQRAMGSRQALLLSAALFAAAHLQPYFVAGLFIVGLVIGAVYQRTHSLLACVFVHGLYNLLSLSSWEETATEESSSWTDGDLGLPLALAGIVVAWWALRRLPQRNEPDSTSMTER